MGTPPLINDDCLSNKTGVPELKCGNAKLEENKSKSLRMSAALSAEHCAVASVERLKHLILLSVCRTSVCSDIHAYCVFSTSTA